MSSHLSLLSRWNRTITAEIWRRAAKMVAACLPGDGEEAQFLVSGERQGEDEDLDLEGLVAHERAEEGE